MSTTREMIGAWFDQGVKNAHQYMIVVCDNYDWEDYPVYADSDSEYKEKHKKCIESNMQKIMEVYDLSLGKTIQLNERRAFNEPKDQS